MRSLQKNPSGRFQQRWIMAISNELSSEIAAAILANQSSPQDRQRLKAVILEIHSTLQKMSEDEHRRRLRAMAAAASPTERGSH